MDMMSWIMKELIWISVGGIPVDIQAQTGRPALEVVYTVLHAGGKFGGGGYKVSGGLHGVGASVVNALSEWLTVQVHRDGKIYEMKFARGQVTQAMTVVGETDHTGTTVTFKPDPEMFDTLEYNYETLHTRMREEAFLNAGLRIQTVDLRPGQEKEDDMCYEGGIREFVTFINRNKTPIPVSYTHLDVYKRQDLHGRQRHDHRHQGQQEQAHRTPAQSALPELPVGNIGQIDAQEVEVQIKQSISGITQRSLDLSQHTILIQGLSHSDLRIRAGVGNAGDLCDLGNCVLRHIHQVSQGLTDDIVQGDQNEQGQEGPQAAAHGVDLLPLIELLDLRCV